MVSFLPSLAYAQAIKIRNGEHEQYSRLVVEWPKKASAQTQKNAGQLKLTFDQSVNQNNIQQSTSGTRNINNVTIVNSAPLTLTLDIPQNSRTREFYVGNRFILDVYNPPGTPSPSNNIVQRKPPKPAPKAKPEKPAQQEVMAAKVEPVEVVPSKSETMPETQNKENAEDRIFAQLSQSETRASLIAFSSSQTFGLAVFERGGKIYVINDKPDLLMTPKLQGDDANKLAPINQTEKDAIKIFTASAITGQSLRTQGGGLLWKVIISNVPTKQEPTKPIRRNEENSIRSGKMIFPFREASKKTMIKDPVTGRDLIVITSNSSRDFAGMEYRLPDFDVLNSAAGLVVLPKVDDLSVEITRDGVEISRPEGLAILSDEQIARNKIDGEAPVQVEKPADATRIYDFKNWQLGGIPALRDNKNILLSNASQLPDSERDENLMTLAKMYLSNAMGSEALGFLAMVQANNPEIENTPAFRALRGAAYAIDYQTERAFNDIAIKDLENFTEIGFWKAYVLADIGDWQQAIEVMPDKAYLLYDYPDLVLNRIGLVATEVALRAGNTELSEEIINIIKGKEGSLEKEQKAALKYLDGELARQKGDLDKTKKLWEPLTTGRDDLYRARAGLALTRLKVEQGDLTPEEAVDNLERLRYAWRGDELEARIGYWLGRTYFEARDFVKGLNLMREAATVAAGSAFGKRITDEMSELFTEVYLGDEINQISPMAAVALYDQFSELIPTGDMGNKIVERMADRLAAVDLLDRAAGLLDYQLEHRIDGLDAYNVAVKLSAIHLLNAQPEEAIRILDTAQSKFDGLPEEMKTADKIQDMTLLRARALSRNGRPDQGIELLETLNPNPSTNSLRADIAWTSGYWDDAAAALGDVITDQNISLKRPLSHDHATLIMNRAISLNLASDRIGLANMREKYSDAMAQTEKARLFEVITRPRQSSALADRDTLMNIVSEVDLFKDFLDSYRTVTAPSN